MKKALHLLAFTATVTASSAALAAEKTATVEVTGLYCASCPYIAAQAIQQVASAKIVDGFYDPAAQMAHFVIQYDDTQATVAQLVNATTEYGYPARLVETAADGSS